MPQYFLGFFISFLFFPFFVVAETVGITESEALSIPSRDSSRFGFKASMGYATDLIRQKDGADRESLAWLFQPHYQVTPTYSFRARISLDQDLSGYSSENLDFSEVSMGAYRAPRAFTNRFRWSFGMNSVLATSRYAVETVSLIGAIEPVAQFVWTAWPQNGLSLIYSPQVRWNFHRFETTRGGDHNQQFIFGQSFSAIWNYFSQIQLRLTASLFNGLTYEGTGRSRFILSQSLAWRITEYFVTEIRHSRGGDTISPDGYSSNIGLFDENSSHLLLAAAYRF